MFLTHEDGTFAAFKGSQDRAPVRGPGTPKKPPSRSGRSSFRCERPLQMRASRRMRRLEPKAAEQSEQRPV